MSRQGPNGLEGSSAPNLIRRINAQLSRRRRTQIAFLVILTIVGAFAEFLSVGALFPLITAMVAPNKVASYPILSWVIEAFGVQSRDQIIALFSSLFIVLILLTTTIRLTLFYANQRLSVAIGSEFSSATYQLILSQPYERFVQLNSSVLISNIEKTNSLASGFFQPLFTMVSSSFVIVAIIVGLLAIELMMTLILFAVFGGCYLLISWIVKKRIEENGKILADQSTIRVRLLQEGIGAYRDIILNGLQNTYSNVFRYIDRSVRWAHGRNAIIAFTPRIALEAVGAVVLVVIAWILGRGDADVTASLPVLGVLAFGAQRLIPALQLVYSAWSTLVSSKARVADSLDVLEYLDQGVIEDGSLSEPSPFRFEQAISLTGVGFRYELEDAWVFRGIDLRVEKGECLGVFGLTGHGKSTLLDILMGLLPPTEGELLVDGRQVFGDRVHAWHEAVAYAPQNVFLADVSIAENITLGVPEAEVDENLLSRVIEMAQLVPMVSGLAVGTQTVVGERGIRLSGGQRQRIGIARALYRQRDVLVLDEATNALDIETEALVLDSLKELVQGVTILLVSHRESTLAICDRLLVVSDGSVQEITSSSGSRHLNRLGTTREEM